VIAAARHGRQSNKSSHSKRVDHGVRAARDHDIRITATNDLEGFTDGLGARRASRHAVKSRTTAAKDLGKVAENSIGFLLEFALDVQHAKAGLGPAAGVHGSLAFHVA